MFYNIVRASKGEQNREIFKMLENTDGIWEFRALFNKTAYRLFAFWDNEQEAMVVATHGLIKKSQKTPTKDIKHAEAIKDRYFKEK